MNKASNVVKNWFAPMVNYSSILIGVWVFICVGLTIMDEVKRYSESLNFQVNIFKEMCVSDNGKVRHEDSILIPNVYCMTPNGDEIIFSHKRPSTDLVIPAVDRIFLGIFDLKSTFE